MSHHAPFDNVPHTETLDNPARPLSTSTTIRGILSSSPIMPKDGNLTFEHYRTLTNMILAEQAARQNLEAAVLNLQQRLQNLLSASYPTADLDHVGTRGTAAGGEFSSFEQDDSSDDEGRYTREEFQTPNEESGPFGDEIFGDVSASGAVSKHAPRTLSLSQMTLGKGAQASTNF